MKRGNLAVSIAALLAFAGYTIFIVIVSVSAGKGHGSAYWSSIALLVLLIVAALWGANYLFRRRRSS